jgi:hypothetical protein
MRHLGVVIAIVALQLTPLAAQKPLKPQVGDVYVDGAAEGGPLCNVEDVACRASPTVFASLTLPAGSYTIAAKLYISNDYDVNYVESYCYLTTSSGILDLTAVSTTQNVSYVAASLQAAAAFSGDETVSLICQRNPFNTNGPTRAGAIQLIATRVGTLHVQ